MLYNMIAGVLNGTVTMTTASVKRYGKTKGARCTEDSHTIIKPEAARPPRDRRPFLLPGAGASP